MKKSPVLMFFTEAAKLAKLLETEGACLRREKSFPFQMLGHRNQTLGKLETDIRCCTFSAQRIMVGLDSPVGLVLQGARILLVLI